MRPIVRAHEGSGWADTDIAAATVQPDGGMVEKIAVPVADNPPADRAMRAGSHNPKNRRAHGYGCAAERPPATNG